MASAQDDLLGSQKSPEPTAIDPQLSGKVAVVVGGAGAIGSAIASALSRQGATVVIADAAPTTEEVWSRIQKETGRNGRTLRVDLTKADEIESAFSTVHDDFNRLDILVHAAGIYLRRGLLEMTPEEWDQTQAVNVRSFFLCAKAAAREMMARGEGRIIGITSGMAVAGRERSSAYSASKAAMIAFAKSVAPELSSTGITINCIGPGITDTPLMRNANTEEEIKQSAARLGRPISTPDNVVGPVLYLLSDATKLVSGTTVWMKSPD
ncbi:MAG: SDR family oxidoreductase [Actinomycetota bacterium]|nr:MAG: SDR family oxidoreductase [Actinomycetota bacterium]